MSTRSPFGRLPHKDLLSIGHLSSGDIRELYATASALKRAPRRYARILEGQRLGRNVAAYGVANYLQPVGH